MIQPLRILPLSIVLAAPSAAGDQLRAALDAGACPSCLVWNRERAAFRIHGDTWYVGVEGLSVLAIDTDAGVILLDGALPQSVQPIEKNLAAMGRSLADVRLIANSHAHFDHAGGIAELARRSGATVLASVAGAAALKRGGPTEADPQYGFGDTMNAFPAVAEVRALTDRESITLGELTLTAHYTPGHTPGATSWTWRSCEADQCVDIVYADSLNAIAAPGFRFSNGDYAVRFAAGIERLAALPCDIVVAVHPEMTDTFAKLAANARDPSRNAFIEPGGCRKYADAAHKRLAFRLSEERKAGR
jgi:metallo-beta-lactamase class B